MADEVTPTHLIPRATEITLQDLIMMVIDPEGTHLTRTVLAETLQSLLMGTGENYGDFTMFNGTYWQKYSKEEVANVLRSPVIGELEKSGAISNPQAVFGQAPQIPIMRAKADLTITWIHIHGSDTSSPGGELTGDLKYADDLSGFANAAIIDVCDTTNGIKTISSGFDNANVPSGKYIYFQMDSAPHADWKYFFIEIHYTFD